MSGSEKLTTYSRVRSSTDPDAPPEWPRLDSPPATTDALYGELRVENDDQVALIYFTDEAAHARVTRGARDAAALVQEWMIPHPPARRPGDD